MENLPMFIEHNNTLITDPNSIENTFNDELASNICADGNNEMYKQYFLTQSQCTCTFEKIHEDDILKLLIKWTTKVVQVMTCFLIKL